MRKLLTIVLGTVSLVAVAGLAYAAEAAPAVDAVRLDASSAGVALAAAAIAMAVAAFGCGIAQGMGLKAACEGLARNPEAEKKLTTMLLLGLAFIESLAIYTLVISLLLIFVNPFA